MSSKKDSRDRRLTEHLAMQAYAAENLGESAWRLLRTYGRVMQGANAGSYISGVSVPEVRAIVDALIAGQVVNVHLMHRHRSGHYESSSLMLREGQLVMQFSDRTELA